MLDVARWTLNVRAAPAVRPPPFGGYPSAQTGAITPATFRRSPLDRTYRSAGKRGVSTPTPSTTHMKNTLLRLLLALICTVCTAMGDDKLQPKLDTIVDNAMKGYNAGDAKAFFADYASTVSAIATPENYKAMYEDAHKAKLGKFVSKT